MDTRVRTLQLATSKLRRGSFVPSNPGAATPVEQAPVAVVQKAYVNGGLYPRSRLARQAFRLARHEQGPGQPPCAAASTRDPRLRRRRARDGRVQHARAERGDRAGPRRAVAA